MVNTPQTKNISATFTVTATIDITGREVFTVTCQNDSGNQQVQKILNSTSDKIRELEYKNSESRARSKLLSMIIHPRSSYIFFVMKNGRKFDGMNGKEKLRALGKAWREMNDHERAPYITLSTTDSERYRQDKINLGLEMPDLVCGEHNSTDCPYCTQQPIEYTNDEDPVIVPNIPPDLSHLSHPSSYRTENPIGKYIAHFGWESHATKTSTQLEKERNEQLKVAAKYIWQGIAHTNQKKSKTAQFVDFMDPNK